MKTKAYLLSKDPALKRNLNQLSSMKERVLERQPVYFEAWVVQQNEKLVAVSFEKERPEHLDPKTGIETSRRGIGALEGQDASRKDTLWGDAKRLSEILRNFIAPMFIRAKRFSKVTDARLVLDDERSLEAGAKYWFRILGRGSLSSISQPLRVKQTDPSAPRSLLPVSDLLNPIVLRQRAAGLGIAVLVAGIWAYNFTHIRGSAPDVTSINEKLQDAQQRAEAARLTYEAQKTGKPVMAAIQSDGVLDGVVDSLVVSGVSNQQPILLVHLNQGRWAKVAPQYRMPILKNICSLWAKETKNVRAHVKLLLPSPEKAPERVPSNWQLPQPLKAGACYDNVGEDFWVLGGN